MISSHYQPEQSGTHDLNSFSVGAIPAEVHELLLKMSIVNGTQRAGTIRLLCWEELWLIFYGSVTGNAARIVLRNADIHQIESLLLILSLTGIASRKIRTAIYGRMVSVVAKEFARGRYGLQE